MTKPTTCQQDGAVPHVCDQEPMTTTDPTAPATPGETANVHELADELVRNLPKVRKDFQRMLDAIMKASGDDDPTAVLKRMFYAFLIEHDHETLAATAAIAVQALVQQAKGARATDPALATPPEHQPGVDPDWCGYLAAEAADQLREAGMPVLAEHVEALEKWHRGEGSDAWPRRPVSSTPPAGTETASATAVDLPAGAVTL